MRCSKCGNDNREGRKFCAECGTALASKCPRCGVSNEPGEKFCGECGAALDAPAAAKRSADSPIRVAETTASDNLEGERKTVTALFADIKGSTELEQGLKQGDRSLAEADFREAIVLAQKMGAKAWELRASTSLARLLRDTDRRGEARTTLADIYNWFTEGFDTSDLKDAKALLNELGQ